MHIIISLDGLASMDRIVREPIKIIVTQCFSTTNVAIPSIDDASGKCKWRVTLPPTPGSIQESYTITATSQKYGSIKISDVLFGDVWVCSGQSNMQFTVSQVRSEIEYTTAEYYIICTTERQCVYVCVCVA